MKIWITGASGLLGRAIVACCQKKHIAFCATTRAQADITSLENLKRYAQRNSFSHVINCAAFTDVDKAEFKSKEAYAINAEGVENLGKLCQEFPLKVIHISTDYVFDGESNRAYTEKDQTNPLGVYGKSKLEGEQRLLEKAPHACIVRTSWIFGRGGNNFISKILFWMHQQAHIQAVRDQTNKATFNLDLAEVLIEMLDQKGIYHFANETALNRYQVACDVYAEGQKRGLPLKCQTIAPVSLFALPKQSPRPLFSVLSTEKIEHVLGRKPRLWKTVLSEYLDQVQHDI